MSSGGSGTDWDLERLKLLFDYTKFHIGVYTSVATVFGALVAAEDKLPIKPNPSLLIAAIAFILIAGAAGGTIASTIPHVTEYKKFWEVDPIGPWGIELFAAKRWAFIEHTAFWVAVALAVLSLVIKV